MDTNGIILFGKFRGQHVNNLMQDISYMNWVLSESKLKSAYPVLVAHLKDKKQLVDPLPINPMRYEQLEQRLARCEQLEQRLARCEQLEQRLARCEQLEQRLARCEQLEQRLAKCEQLNAQCSTCCEQLKQQVEQHDYRESQLRELCGQPLECCGQQLERCEQHLELCGQQLECCGQQLERCGQQLERCEQQQQQYVAEIGKRFEVVHLLEERMGLHRELLELKCLELNQRMDRLEAPSMNTRSRQRARLDEASKHVF